MNGTPTILYEDADLIVIDKPSGMLAHAPDGKRERAVSMPTVADWARPRIHDPRLLNDTTRAGIVHRLDAETSGVMVIAKTADALAALKQQFQTRQVKKEYAALVHGKIPRPEGTIAFPIARATSKRKRGIMVAKSMAEDGRAAVTHFVVEAASPRYTLLTVTPETGRTHQIRVHLTAYGHPIVGDREYANKKWKDDAPRLFLHAAVLGFRHPSSGEFKKFESPLPEALIAYLKKKNIRL